MKIVVLDRDGVINEDSDEYVKNPDEWTEIPGSIEAIARFNRAGFRVVVATNQAGIERNLFNMTQLNSINQKMHSKVKKAGGKIHAIFYCPCLDSPSCTCRKPKPGMLLDIARRFNVSPEGIPFIGDSLRDLKAAENAGYIPILVLTGNGQKTRENPEIPPNTVIYKTLAHAAKNITTIN